MEKAEIRKKILEIRKKLGKKTVAANSIEILKKLLRLVEFQKAKKIMFYSDFKNEVATGKMVNKTLSLGKQVFMPKIVRNKIVPSRIENLKDMVLGKFGIHEPKSNFYMPAPPKFKRGEPYAICDIDVVVVPGVVFDGKCRRVGWGKGYYDSFLRNTRVTKIGIAHSLQVVKNVPAGKNDVPMDFVITEKEIFKRNAN